MAKRSNRKSISLKGTTYQRLKNFCESQKMSVSGQLEVWINAKLDEMDEPTVEPADVQFPEREKAPDPETIISQHFTF